MPSIIVADDYEDTAAALADLLAFSGCTVRIAKNGREALDAFLAEVPDGLVLDLDMPKLTGFEVCRAIRDAGFLGPVVAYSGRNDPEVQASVAAAGFTAYVQKPGKSGEVERKLGLGVGPPVPHGCS